MRIVVALYACCCCIAGTVCGQCGSAIHRGRNNVEKLGKERADRDFIAPEPEWIGRQDPWSEWFAGLDGVPQAR